MSLSPRAHAAPPPAPRHLAALGGWLLLTFAFAAAGAVASAQAGSFYLQLQRPAWAPPAWLFGPAWSVLYLLMALAAWRATRAPATATEPGATARAAAALYLVQLAANALWTWLFFVWHRGGLASAEIVVLWLLIAATIAVFRRRDRLAAVLLLPYLAWVSFACALSATIWRLNPALL